MPSLRGLNFWTLKQKIKDHTTQRTSTIQLLQKIDIYHLNDVDRAKLTELTDGKEQQSFIMAHGKLDRSTGEMKSHSFVLQFLQVLEASFAGAYRTNTDIVWIKDTGNSARAETPNYLYFSVNATYAFGLEAPATMSDYGIVVGTGTNTPTNADYKMQTQTVHGVSANQLQYQATSVGAAGINGANVDLVISRVLINGSGGSITLKEIGIYGKSASDGYIFLLAHDAVDQAIANGEIAVITYDIRTTV